MKPTAHFRFAIDRGGTFTDIYCEIYRQNGDSITKVLKLLSEDPINYKDAPTEGIRRILQEEFGIDLPKHLPIPTANIISIRMGTTVATNALLERKGERVAFITTKGCRDLQVIGNQSRPKIFDLEIKKPDLLYEYVTEINERVIFYKEDYEDDDGKGNRMLEDDDINKNITSKTTSTTTTTTTTSHSSSASSSLKSNIVTGVSQDKLLIETPLNDMEVITELHKIQSLGITSLAVCLLHSYIYPHHEKRIGELAKEMGGFTQISLSHEVMPMVRIVPRGCTTCVDAYLTPVLQKYLNSFAIGFDEELTRSNKVCFMQSDGGLTTMKSFKGSRAILSGPAGGVVGFAITSTSSLVAEQQQQQQNLANENSNDPNSMNITPQSSSLSSAAATATASHSIPNMPAVIGFDMGGTSTDVSRYAGVYEHVFESTTAGVTIQSPQLDINTVAAGGGSRLFYRNGLFVVGPESAGANPGPACYRKNGPLTITDANVVLGRIQPHLFPAIFGASEREMLYVDASRKAFEQLTDDINQHQASLQSSSSSASVQSSSSSSLLKSNHNNNNNNNQNNHPPPHHHHHHQSMNRIYTLDEVAAGFIRVANEAMARPIRNLTTMKGHDVTKHVLATFGGAGPQHCCAIAKSLGIQTIVLSKYAGVLSAYGLSLADIVVDKQEPCDGSELSLAVMKSVIQRLDVLEQHARKSLIHNEKSGSSNTDDNTTTTAATTATSMANDDNGITANNAAIENSSISSVFYVNCRYQGTDTAMMIPFPYNPVVAAVTVAGSRGNKMTNDDDYDDDDVVVSNIAKLIQSSFVSTYKQEYGFELVGRSVLVDDIRVRVESHSRPVISDLVLTTAIPSSSSSSSLSSKVKEYVSVYFDETGRYSQTPVYSLTDLTATTGTSGSSGNVIIGPAIIIQDITTIVIEPLCTASVTKNGDIIVRVAHNGHKAVEGLHLATAAPDPIYLSVFSHRFMGIAEQMGRTLQRTSISVNIKERLDFSCALFDCDGGLVANAPHLPVHLGAMSEAVRYQKLYWGSDLSEGDVLVSNHPQLAGGSHLPDITVITPIYIQGKIVFFLASRGHHADVGGIAPGSMPPLSKTLEEEGAAIIAFKLVQQGIFQEQGITDLLLSPGKTRKIIGNSGARKIHDNISDLKAQVAANQKGGVLMHDLIQEYTLPVIQAYMRHIQTCAADAVRNMLTQFSIQHGMKEIDTVTAHDFLDDGSCIKLSITINRHNDNISNSSNSNNNSSNNESTAIFDFTGTDPEVYGNLNAPPAVTTSAVIYCLRCLLPESDIPLNQGCLTPITIIIPSGSLLKPCDSAAVVGGNVLTSQRVTDVVLKAFRACAASQGCMNNLTFGNDNMGYYETIAGGAGAGPHWHGCSAVHTHMTNTRITDAEILEKRYPVILRQFSVRTDSGGVGRYRGGEGVIRELEFTEPLVVSILSERRALAPYGMAGGLCGGKGKNLLYRYIPSSSLIASSITVSSNNSGNHNNSNTTTNNNGISDDVNINKKRRFDNEQQQQQLNEGKRTLPEISPDNINIITTQTEILSPSPPPSSSSSSSSYRIVNVGGKNTVTVQPRDRLVVYTPGGGGYGKFKSSSTDDDDDDDDDVQHTSSSGNGSKNNNRSNNNNNRSSSNSNRGDSTSGGSVNEVEINSKVAAVPVRLSGSLMDYQNAQETV